MNNQMKAGLVHLYCGEGKGKTTASMGLIARALGHQYRVLLVQFLKDGNSGELVSLRRLPGFDVLAGQITGKFSIAMTSEEKEATRALHLSFFHDAIKRVEEAQVDMLVLDEVLGAIECNMMDENELLAFLDARPPSLEVVLTGRHATTQVMARADYISRIECVRHPYERGVLARAGIEY
ncbi:MAG: cob(I)yrinic acid a,c-diamide adenosyltransferase [Ruminococcaceae bacterium]|nr:cob(I)yrinic acid a,c-diamide adenosyltransferase [Oscillospiraceae bacterium]